jgi:F-type H+-transporting ATPase subunit delta
MLTLKNNDIAHAIHEATLGKTGKELDVVLSNTTKFLAKHRLIGRKSEIIFNKLHAIQNKHHGIIEANVKSKNKLSQNSLHEIKHFLTNYYKAEKVEIEEEIDKSLIGGVKIEVGETIIDMTLRKELDQLQKHLLTN